MNYKAWVGWGFYGGADGTERANLWSSWGLMSSLPGQTAQTIKSRVARFWSIFRR